MTRKVRRGEEVKLVLEDDSQLMDEVVVTGYQQLDRRHLTSAVTSVKMDDIRVLGTSNLSQMLEGKIPDMIVSTNSSDINATPRLRIRGTSTIIGNREPLWVVDGIIVTDPVELSPDVLNDPDYVNRIGNAISGINRRTSNASTSSRMPLPRHSMERKPPTASSSSRRRRDGSESRRCPTADRLPSAVAPTTATRAST